MEKEVKISPSVYVQYEPQVCAFTAKSAELVAKRKAEGLQVMCLDQPDWATLGLTPAPELVQAIEGYCNSEKTHGYLPSFGLMSQRQIIADFCSCPSHKVPVSDSYLIYSSYKGFNVTLMTMCDQGDSILVPQLSSDELQNFTAMIGVRIISYKLNLDGSIDLESLQKSVESLPKPPKVMLVHYHHPVLGKEIKNHKEVIDFCAEKRILACFECSFALTKKDQNDWKKIVEDASPKFPLIILYDLSKEHGLNGIILGSATLIDKPKITAPFKNCFENVLQVTLFPCSLTTYLVEDVLKKDCTKAWRDTMREKLIKNAKIVFEGLSAIEGISPIQPDDGYTFYALVDKKLGKSEELCLKLLEKTGFCISPTSRYGDPENAISFYLAADSEIYAQLVSAIQEFLV